MSKLSYHNSCLNERDISLLDDGCWLNDVVIGFVLEYFENDLFPELTSSKVSFVSPEVGQLIKLFADTADLSMILEPLDLKKKDYVMFPVNDNEENLAGGSHWSLLVFERETSTFKHFDSCSGFNNEAASLLAKRLAPLLCSDGSAQMVRGDSPRQTNGYDCGVYVISFVEKICQFLMNEGDSCNSLPDLLSIASSEMAKQRSRFKSIIRDLQKYSPR